MKTWMLIVLMLLAGIASAESKCGFTFSKERNSGGQSFYWTPIGFNVTQPYEESTVRYGLFVDKETVRGVNVRLGYGYMDVTRDSIETDWISGQSYRGQGDWVSVELSLRLP